MRVEKAEVEERVFELQLISAAIYVVALVKMPLLSHKTQRHENATEVAQN